MCTMYRWYCRLSIIIAKNFSSCTCMFLSQDWESMTTLLLDDKCGIKLSETDEGVLVEIMSCAIRRATGTNPPAGRAKGRVRIVI